MSTNPRPQLLRSIGRWSLIALMINFMIGSGIFGLPSTLAGLLGAASPVAVILAGGVTAIVISCYAEVASRFTSSGGPYLYARTAFGRLAGVQVGWLLWLAALTGSAANANLFVSYAAEFWPAAKDPVVRIVILTTLIGLLTLVNYRGVDMGTQVSNVFTVAKLAPLALLIIAGLWFATTRHLEVTPSLPVKGGWIKAVFLCFFLYGGYDSPLAAMAEAKNPRRDAPFALMCALAFCILIYASLQAVVIFVLPGASHSQRPLADTARVMLGAEGAALIAGGAMVSTLGSLCGRIMAVPRLTYALGERGDFPAKFAAVHRRFKTPYFSIVISAALVWALAGFGGFSWNATLSVAARLLYSAVICAALPVLRRRNSEAALFRLRGGVVFAIAGVLLCLVMMTQMDFTGSAIVLVTALIALINWMIVRKRKPQLDVAA